MKPKSAKDKGRRFQQEVAAAIIEKFEIAEPDAVSTAMGQRGADIRLSAAAREVFPYAVECKNVERLNLWDSWAQCSANASSEGLAPLLVVRRNRSDLLAVVTLDEFLRLAGGET